MKKLLLVLFTLALPSLASAQSLDRYLTTAAPQYVDEVAGADFYILEAFQTTAVNPTTASFDLPSDYATATSFDLEIYRQSDMVMVRTTNFGKGTVNGNRVSTPLQPGNGYANNVIYVFRIVENNPLGSTRSVTTSNPFVAGALPVGVSGLVAQ